ncbi:MAG TPA: T9SS type A sorting domain-containing protein [Bacteroidales bacterium]|nr:T9SS type A sorting domain-containing protein [Bacteroidales bacterium]
MTVYKLLFFLLLMPFGLYSQTLTGEFQFLRNGKYVHDSTYIHIWDEAEEDWKNTERYVITARDQYGNHTVGYTKVFRDESQTWEDYKKYQNFYYDSINLHSYQAFVWDSYAGNWKMSDSVYYNLHYLPAVSWYKVWDESKFRFSRGEKRRYSYSAGDILISEEADRFDTLSGNWKNNLLINYSYLENGMLCQQITKKWKNDAFWADSLRITYSYNDQNYMDTALTQLWNENGFWENYQLSVQIQNLSENKEEFYKYNWNAESQVWLNSTYKLVIYNAGEMIREIQQKFWSEYLNTWVDQSLLTNEYNQQGQRISTLIRYWDAFEEFWYNVSNTSYYYDENGNRTAFLFQSWDEVSNSWLNVYKEQYWWSFFEPSSITGSEIIKFSVNPNPANDFIRVSFDNLLPNSGYTLFNSSGVPVISKKRVSRPTEIIEVSNFPNGIYFLKVNENPSVRKIVIF